MRSFDFRLEALLRIRRHRERSWELKLAEVSGACILLEGRLRELDEERAAHSACTFDGILYSLPDLLARGAYALRLEKEIAGTRRELEEKRRERVQVNAEYLAASRDRKVLDKLKERRSREYYRSQLKEEGKALDEIGAGMAVRSRLAEKG